MLYKFCWPIEQFCCFFFLAISEQNEVTLYNISRHTNRRYECVASNGYPPDVARSFQFVIQYPPEITLFVNEQIAPKSLFTKNYQQEIHLKCQVLMYPSEKILWMKDDRPIDAHYQVYEIGNYIISELTVQLLTDADQGAYSCVASNSLGSDSQTVHLSTLSRPTTTTKRVTARRKRPKYFRITSPESSSFYSTESSRMMTISSAGKAANNDWSIHSDLFSNQVHIFAQRLRVVFVDHSGFLQMNGSDLVSLHRTVIDGVCLFLRWHRIGRYLDTYRQTYTHASERSLFLLVMPSTPDVCWSCRLYLFFMELPIFVPLYLLECMFNKRRTISNVSLEQWN